MYKRKTQTVYLIQTNHGYGWDTETTETSYEAAKRTYRDYIENSAARWVTRLVKTREPILQRGASI